ncbi:hypothetical protein CDAR_261041 [Caerostris darwini]|uniref:Uncharacterized protein n=1 Tax=Caerostris darwini TaxID=1538125 RepID=A0AAV4TF76_9ARAC|nr:hypothetical protein CDAR_261041 [Caerostris darwini]
MSHFGGQSDSSINDTVKKREDYGRRIAKDASGPSVADSWLFRLSSPRSSCYASGLRNGLRVRSPSGNGNSHEGNTRQSYKFSRIRL